MDCGHFRIKGKYQFKKLWKLSEPKSDKLI